MGGGISTNGDLSQMIACTMLIGEAMFQGLDPRYVRFPDMYRLYDFHIGKKKFRTMKPGGATIVVFNADGSSGMIDRVTGEPTDSANDEQQCEIDEEDTSKYLVVKVGDDQVVLDLATLNTPNEDGWTPLHASCHTLNATEAGKTILKRILALDPSADLNSKTLRGPGSFSSGYTPLHIACAYGMEKLVTKLIKANANVHVKNGVDWTPLHEACHRGFTEIVRELLRAGAKADEICPEYALCPFPGQTALGEAARQGHLDTVKLLLDHGVDKNATNNLNWTALHEASYHNRSEIVRTLVVYGADVMIKTNRGAKASDLTISVEIKTMLDDMCRATEQEERKSPPKPQTTCKSSPKHDQETSNLSTGPLSCKEDYALLGDLPSLQRLHLPLENDQVIKPNVQKKKKKKKESNNEIPKEFQCAITKKLLRDPVKSPYGHIFERSIIEKWIQDYGHRCPITGDPLGLGQLTSDIQLKQDIQGWLAPDSPSKESMKAQEIKPVTAHSKPDDAKESKQLEAKEEDIYDF